MRVGGINLAAVIGAAIAVYIVGFVIYGLLVPAETWMELSGLTEDQLNAVDRMPFSPVMPLMTALFLAVLFRLGNVQDSSTGMKWAAIVALASGIPTLLYGWVYGIGPLAMTAIDSGHILVGHIVAGGILGRWR